MSFIRYIPMITVMGIIFFLSNQPGDRLDLPDIPDLDKVLHAVAYGVLAFTVLFAVPENKNRKNPWGVSLLVVMFCLLYGISDEFHQSFVPNRMPSVMDVIADTTGAVVVVFIWFQMKKQEIGAEGKSVQ